MARSVNMRVFYAALALIAVAGIAAIWMARARSGAGPEGTSVTSAALANLGDYEGYVIGSDSAPVEIIEFADFQCSACARFAILTGSDVKAGLVERGLARLRFHDFPLPIHNNAMPAHLAAACAGEQGQFWAMHDQLFYNQGRWSRESRPNRQFRQYAEALGLDTRQFDDCLGSERQRARIEAAKNEAVALGVGATPSFLIGDRLVSGALPFDSLRTLVEKAARSATQ